VGGVRTAVVDRRMVWREKVRSRVRQPECGRRLEASGGLFPWSGKRAEGLVGGGRCVYVCECMWTRVGGNVYEGEREREVVEGTKAACMRWRRSMPHFSIRLSLPKGRCQQQLLVKVALRHHCSHRPTCECLRNQV